VRNVVLAKNFTSKNSKYFSRTLMKLSKVENLLLFYLKLSFCFVKRTNILYEINTKNPLFKGFFQFAVSAQDLLLSSYIARTNLPLYLKTKIPPDGGKVFHLAEKEGLFSMIPREVLQMKNLPFASLMCILIFV